MRTSLLASLVRRFVGVAAITVLAAPVAAVASGTHATPGAGGDLRVVETAVAPVAAIKVRLRAAVRNLPLAPETPAGYQRSKFRHWIDANGDCQDTRAEVLRSESRVKVSGCQIRSGKWYSYYDRRTWTRASDVDIDHLVPLKEAWDSGAKRWNADTRKRYANDLGDGRTLIAVTDNVNQAKADRDPADWMPRFGKCRYVMAWTVVKTRWSLKANRAEKARLMRIAAGCDNVVLTIHKAGIVKAAASGGSTTGGTSGGTTSTTDPRYSTCTEAKSHGYGPYYRGHDSEYYWYQDRDSDGIVCE